MTNTTICFSPQLQKQLQQQQYYHILLTEPKAFLIFLFFFFFFQNFILHTLPAGDCSCDPCNTIPYYNHAHITSKWVTGIPLHALGQSTALVVLHVKQQSKAKVHWMLLQDKECSLEQRRNMLQEMLYVIRLCPSSSPGYCWNIWHILIFYFFFRLVAQPLRKANILQKSTVVMISSSPRLLALRWGVWLENVERMKVTRWHRRNSLLSVVFLLLLFLILKGVQRHRTRRFWAK